MDRNTGRGRRGKQGIWAREVMGGRTGYLGFWGNQGMESGDPNAWVLGGELLQGLVRYMK